jgi:hypothetical protein
MTDKGLKKNYFYRENDWYRGERMLSGALHSYLTRTKEGWRMSGIEPNIDTHIWNDCYGWIPRQSFLPFGIDPWQSFTANSMPYIFAVAKPMTKKEVDSYVWHLDHPDTFLTCAR